MKSSSVNVTEGETLLDKLALILKNWQERLIDVSKSNPLLGLNRSRAVRLEIGTPDFTFLSKTLIDDEGQIKLPFVQKKAQRTLLTDEEGEKIDIAISLMIHYCHTYEKQE